MGRDHSIECEKCGASYGGFNGPDECDCEKPLITDLVLHCPMCKVLHLDVDEWRDRPHKTHLCLNEKCGHLFRPLEAYTRGVSPDEASYATVVRSLARIPLDQLRVLLEGLNRCGHLAVFVQYDGNCESCSLCGSPA